MKSIKSVIGLILITTFSFFISSCCNDHLNLYVFVGHLNQDECQRNIKQLGEDNDTVRFLCPGEEVTICWRCDSNIQLDPGFGIQDPTGMKYLTVKSDTTIKATAQSDCGDSREVQVKVVSGPTPSTWTGKFNSTCSDIEFEIHKEFISENIKAIDISAQWQPTINLKDGSTYTCITPPFLDGFQQEEVFGFTIQEPFVTEAFSRKLKAVGHWKFVWKADCDGITIDCPSLGGPSFPFDITLTCN